MAARPARAEMASAAAAVAALEEAMSGSGAGSSDEEDDDECCVACRLDDNAHEMLECDSCDAGWHMCLAAASHSHSRCHSLRSASRPNP